MLVNFVFIALLIAGTNGHPKHEEGHKDEETPKSNNSTTPAPELKIEEIHRSPSTSPTTDNNEGKTTTPESTTDEALEPEEEIIPVEETIDFKANLNKYRWDEDRKKYIRLGTTVNCPPNMRFFAVQTNDTTGKCDCDYYQCLRPLLYSPVTHECHFAWTRGPCEETEWYAFDSEFHPVCEPRKCYEGLSDEPVTPGNVSLSYWFTDPHDESEICQEASSDETCEVDGQALFLYPGDPIPRCRQTAVCVPLASPEPQLCFRGNRRFYEGECQ